MKAFYLLILGAIIAGLFYVASLKPEPVQQPSVGIPIPCETMTHAEYQRQKHRRFPHSR